MKRRIGWAGLVAVGMVLGSVLGSYEGTRAAAPAAREVVTEEPDTDMVEQLKDIKAQVKDINALLHSGTLKVIVVINPDRR